MKGQQLYFTKPNGEPLKYKTYDVTICRECCCNKCKKNAESTHVSNEECVSINPCFNCDECYYYGMDNEELDRRMVKFKCDKFEISNHYAEVRARREREKFKIIRSNHEGLYKK